MAPPPPAVTLPTAEPVSLQARLAELSDAYFEYDRNDIREDARAVLAKDGELLRSILADFPDVLIVLEATAMSADPPSTTWAKAIVERPR